MMKLLRFLDYIDAATTNMKNTWHVIVVESYFSNETRWYSAMFKNSNSHFKLQCLHFCKVLKGTDGIYEGW
jgi:hypothetical protein